jgi:hypothetical protein
MFPLTTRSGTNFEIRCGTPFAFRSKNRTFPNPRPSFITSKTQFSSGGKPMRFFYKISNQNREARTKPLLKKHKMDTRNAKEREIEKNREISS